MKKGKNYLFRFLSIMFICIFCAVTLCGCLGGGGSSYGSGGGSGNSPSGGSGNSPSGGSGGGSGSGGSQSEDDKLKNPFASDGRYVKNFNDVFLGVVGVYDIDNTAKVFYDPYTASSSDNEDAIVNFDFLIDRQFNALSSIICQSLELYYAENGGPSCISVNDYMPDGATLEASVDDYFDTYNVFQYTSKEHKASLNYQKAKEGGFPMICDEYKFLDEENSIQAEDDEGNLLYESDGSPVWETKVYNYEYYYYYDIDGYSPSVDAGWEEKNTIVANNFLTEWKNKDISVEEMASQLKTIYIDCYSKKNAQYASVNKTIGDGDLNFTNTSLATMYSGSSVGVTSSNDDIKTIGFTKEFMWHTLYYLAYNVIGEDHIKASTDYRNIVFSGGDVRSTRENDVFIEESSDNSPLNHDDIARNLAIFQNYKGYDYILLEIINKAFMAIKDDTDTLANSETANYCFDKRADGIQIDYNQSLFPFLERNEYIFYDKIEEICDAEGEGKTQGDSNKYENMDWDNYDPETINPNEGKEEGEKKKEKAFKVGTKRKLKQLIFLPKINRMKYNYETFEISAFWFGFVAGEISDKSNNELDSKNTVGNVNISIKIDLDMVGVKCDDKDSIIDYSYKLDEDEAYFRFDSGDDKKEVEMPDGSKLDLTETPEGLDKYVDTNVRKMLNDEGYYVVNNRNLVSDFLVSGSLFESREKTKEFQFGDLDMFNFAKQAFGFRYDTGDIFDVTEQKYKVETTGEELTINRLNICNEFLKTTLLDEDTGVAKNDTAYNMNENYIRMLFKYFDHKGTTELTEIPEMYLMEFLMA